MHYVGKNFVQSGNEWGERKRKKVNKCLSLIKKKAGLRICEKLLSFLLVNQVYMYIYIIILSRIKYGYLIHKLH